MRMRMTPAETLRRVSVALPKSGPPLGPAFSAGHRRRLAARAASRLARSDLLGAASQPSPGEGSAFNADTLPTAGRGRAEGENGMRRFVLATIAMVAVVCSIPTAQDATADEVRAVRHGGKRYVCQGPECGPHKRCGWRCRVRCPDTYSCYSLYGAYGPYGGNSFLGSLYL